MRLSKKVVSLICLASLTLGFTSSSKCSSTYNSSLSSIKFDANNKSTVEQMSVVKSNSDDKSEEIAKEEARKAKEAEELKVLEEEKSRLENEKAKLEQERKSSVTYSRENITLLSHITQSEMRNVLMHYKGASTMSHLSDALVEAENQYGVNAFTMAAIVALESGFATSRRAVEDNNLTGYEVYSDDSEGRLFSSQYESVLHTARHLSKNYLSPGGVYYKGLSVDAVQVSYCPDEGKGKNWDGKVDKLATGFLKVYKELYL
ncbi:MAG: glucosaminidase domain-containing protein [Romboutsia sp.]|uniref:glucosaminidase domain-containing protein n=1 Tax=Romboutsia sp. TaxID=1965302 RepID=UPI003F2A153D